jgi:hypothetical protein
MGSVRFGVPQELVLWARDALNVRTFVETGTNRAQTSVWAARHFSKVVTIEGQESLYRAALAAHGQVANLEFLHGDSRALLGPVLDKLNEPAVLWLDAHWCGEGTFGPTAECPLLEELERVNQSHPEHVILIDDARLFVAPPPLPHAFEDWPGLLEVANKLSQGPTPRYSAIFEDVIVGVPLSKQKALVDFIRSVAARPSEEQEPLSLPRKLLSFAKKGRRRLGS